MGANHTFFENTKVLSLLAPVSVAASLTTASLDTTEGRGNAILVQVATFAFTGTNSLTLNLEESDDDSVFTTVVNGENLGQQVGTKWGDMTGNAELDDTDSDPNTLLNGASLVLDAAGNDDKVYVAEYLGSKKFVRLNIVEAGIVVVLMAVTSGQNALRLLPNIVSIGDNS